MSDPQRPHGLQPTRLLCPWDFPGKSTGVGCHCLLQEVPPSQRQVRLSEDGQVGGLRDSPASCVEWFTYCCCYLLAGLKGGAAHPLLLRPQSQQLELPNCSKSGSRLGLFWWIRDKEFSCNAGEAGFISGWGRSPGEKNCNSL